jgi:hypothetical protein
MLPGSHYLIVYGRPGETLSTTVHMYLKVSLHLFLCMSFSPAILSQELGILRESYCLFNNHTRTHPYTVKKVCSFSIPSRDVTNHTFPGRE